MIATNEYLKSSLQQKCEYRKTSRWTKEISVRQVEILSAVLRYICKIVQVHRQDIETQVVKCLKVFFFYSSNATNGKIDVLHAFPFKMPCLHP